MLFGECLHNYLIKDAIFDNNVLGFHIEYIKTMEGDFDWDDPTLADAIDIGELYMSDERKIIASLDEINFGVDDTKIDVLGNAYEYLIGQFAATAGKKAGEFYTPSGPAELLCRLACLGLTDVKDAADPTCGSGSLLLRLKNYANVRNYYGQELTSTTYNLARMNMILRGIPYRNFNIYNGDTLEHDCFGDMKFRVQVANPPYSANWSADMHFMEDERFNEYGKLAPKSKADFAFVQHIMHTCWFTFARSLVLTSSCIAAFTSFRWNDYGDCCRS